MPTIEKRRQGFAAAAATVMAFCAAAGYFSYVTADPDLWGHIRFGEDLWRAGTLPDTDPYSFTAAGKTWVNHEWLTELAFYLTYRLFGDAGLLLGKLAIGFAVVGILCRVVTFRPYRPVVYGGVLLLTVATASRGFMIRPQVFSFLFFALFLYVFHLLFIKNRNRLFLLPLFMAAWVNLHGGFLMGWVLFGIITAWTTFSHLALKKQKHVKRLWLWLLLTTASMLVNPYGYKLLTFLYRTLSLPRQISEWAPVPLWDVSYPYLKGMALAVVLTLLMRRRHLWGWETAATVATLFAAFHHQRHAPFFAMTAAPFLAHHLSAALTVWEKDHLKKVFPVTLRHAAVALFAVIAAFQLYHGTRQYVLSGLRIVVDPRTYPVAALRFLSVNGLQGDLIVPFDWGEHAIWKLYPRCRVSIDGRFRTVYPEPVIHDHFVAEGDRKGWADLIEEYDADLLLARQSPFFQEMIERQGPWIYVYSDPISIVFIRNNNKNANALTDFADGRFTYPTAPPSPYFPG